MRRRLTLSSEQQAQVMVMRELFVASTGTQGHPIAAVLHIFDSQVEVLIATPSKSDTSVIRKLVETASDTRQTISLVDIRISLIERTAALILQQHIIGTKASLGTIDSVPCLSVVFRMAKRTLSVDTNPVTISHPHTSRFVEMACLLFHPRTIYDRMEQETACNLWRVYEHQFLKLMNSDAGIAQLRMFLPLCDNFRRQLLAEIILRCRIMCNEIICNECGGTKLRAIFHPPSIDVLSVLDDPRYLAIERLDEKSKDKLSDRTIGTNMFTVHVVWGENAGMSLRLFRQDWVNQLRTEYQISTNTSSCCTVLFRDVNSKVVYDEHTPLPPDTSSITVDVLSCTDGHWKRCEHWLNQAFQLKISEPLSWMRLLAAQVKAEFPDDYQQAYRFYMALLDAPALPVSLQGKVKINISEYKSQSSTETPTPPDLISMATQSSSQMRTVENEVTALVEQMSILWKGHDEEKKRNVELQHIIAGLEEQVKSKTADVKILTESLAKSDETQRLSGEALKRSDEKFAELQSLYEKTAMQVVHEASLAEYHRKTCVQLTSDVRLLQGHDLDKATDGEFEQVAAQIQTAFLALQIARIERVKRQCERKMAEQKAAHEAALIAAHAELKTARAEAEKNKLECCVCMEKRPNWCFKCGHTVCKSCFDRIAEKSPRHCPTCRQPVVGARALFL